MAKIIDFNALREGKVEEIVEGNLKNTTEVKEKKLPANYPYAFMANYDEEELYINYKTNSSDINFDVSVNLRMIQDVIDRNPMTIMNREKIKEITRLEEDKYIEAIFNVYIEFGFIDADCLIPKSLNDIKNTYIKKREIIGYPKNKKWFQDVITLEKKVFGDFVDTSDFNEQLWWRAKKY